MENEEIEKAIDTSEDSQEIELNIDELFNEPDEEESEEEVDNSSKEDNKITTEAVSKRINEVRQKTERETRDKIAKEMGYNDYYDMQKHNEKKILNDAGYDDNDENLNNAIDKLVARRLADDPRWKKLEEYENREKAKFVSDQLKEINSLIGIDNKYTNVEQLPKDVLSLWEKTGNLKQAYLAVEGESLLASKSQQKVSRDSLSHLAEHGNSSTPTKVRGLTNEEKEIYKAVMGSYISEEELNKKTIEIKE